MFMRFAKLVPDSESGIDETVHKPSCSNNCIIPCTNEVQSVNDETIALIDWPMENLRVKKKANPTIETYLLVCRPPCHSVVASWPGLYISDHSRPLRSTLDRYHRSLQDRWPWNWDHRELQLQRHMSRGLAARIGRIRGIEDNPHLQGGISNCSSTDRHGAAPAQIFPITCSRYVSFT